MGPHFTLAGGDGRNYVVMIDPEPTSLPRMPCVVIEAVVHGTKVRCCDGYPLADATQYREAHMPELRRQVANRVKGVLLAGPDFEAAAETFLNISCRFARRCSTQVFALNTGLANDN